MIYPDNKRYFTYDAFLKQKFGSKTIKIPLDGGFSCPNIDGTKGHGGCTYCTKECLTYRGRPLHEQFELAKAPLLKKWGREGVKEQYIQYFQVFSGTYAPVERLRQLYYEAISLPNTVGLSIATRVDCLSDEVIELLHEINEKTFLTVELGLQTVHEETARRINRGHTFSEFLDGYRSLEGIDRVVHLINGLPGESKEMMLESAETVASLMPHGVKLHALYLENGTKMTEEYKASPFPMLTLEEYVDVTVSQLELFHPDTVIGRLTGDGKADNLVAPLWSIKKFCVLNEIDKELRRRNSYQRINFRANNI
jgi:radical SAM protein (TIGR01212 family)